MDTFDGVLVSKNSIDLVSGGREVKRGSGKDPIAKLGKLGKKSFAKVTPKALIRYLMYLPLNFIPVVGTAVFVVLQGRRVGPAAHTRYFQLKGWNNSQKEEHVEKHKAAYTRLATPPLTGVSLSPAPKTITVLLLLSILKQRMKSIYDNIFKKKYLYMYIVSASPPSYSNSSRSLRFSSLLQIRSGQLCGR